MRDSLSRSHNRLLRLTVQPRSGSLGRGPVIALVRLWRAAHPPRSPFDDTPTISTAVATRTHAVTLPSRSRSSVLGCGFAGYRIRKGGAGRAEDANAVSCHGFPDRSVNERRPSSRPWPPRMRANARIVRIAPFEDGSPRARPNIRSQPIRVSLPFCPYGFTGTAMTGPRSIAAAAMARRGVGEQTRGPILGLVGPRLLAYLGQCRVNTAKSQTESFGSARTCFLSMAGAPRRRRRVLRRSRWPPAGLSRGTAGT
jgi:hypothetical protein